MAHVVEIEKNAGGESAGKESSGEDSSCPRGVAVGSSVGVSRSGRALGRGGKVAAEKRPVSHKQGVVRRDGSKNGSKGAVTFSRGDYLVHPAHGVGCVQTIEMTAVGGLGGSGVKLEMIAISFTHDRMVVRVPTSGYENCGLRLLSSPATMRTVYQALRTKRQARKTMWGRRAQEYDNKIKSGDPLHWAHVVRELFRGKEQPDPSYSERQYYQLALGRLSREVAVIESIEEKHAVEKLESILAEAA